MQILALIFMVLLIILILFDYQTLKNGKLQNKVKAIADAEITDVKPVIKGSKTGKSDILRYFKS